MEKIKFIADSACDISKDESKLHNIHILPITIIKDDKIYKDWYDFEPDEFYKNLKDTESLPSTSQVTPNMFLKSFEDAAAEGYNKIICTTLNSLASGCYQSAVMAKRIFFETEGREHIQIEVIDSTTYSYLIGNTVIAGSIMASAGVKFETIVAFMKEQFSKVTAFAVVYTLDFLKKTGRISDFSCLMGNMLDIKPIIKIDNAKIVSFDRARGKKKSVLKLIELVKNNIDPSINEICFIYGDIKDEFEEIEKIILDEFPGFTIKHAKLGSVISINSGPNLFGLAFIAKK